jgi:hypothetical protein
MKEQIKHHVSRCIEELRRGALGEESLQRISELADQLPAGRQDLLYLQAARTSVTSEVIGMSLFVNGVASAGPADAEEWPYKTVSEALADGWRIIKFPEMAVLLDERRTYGLGCEFILEKWN